MWVEFSITIRKRRPLLGYLPFYSWDCGNVIDDVKLHLSRHHGRGRDVPDFIAHGKELYGASSYAQDTGLAYLDRVLGGYSSNRLLANMFWFEESGSDGEAALWVVAEATDTHLKADGFAVRVYDEIEESLPRGCVLRDHQLRIEDVVHYFGVVRPAVAFFTPDAFGALIVALGWSIYKYLTVKPTQDAQNFGISLLANAIFALIVTVVTFFARLITRGRKVVYRND